MTRFTILGATGFIGRHLFDRLSADGEEVQTPGRDETALLAGPLGHVIDCSGINDFMERPRAALEAHAGHLETLLGAARFDSVTFLSTTRLYVGAVSTEEDAEIAVDPGRPWEFFNLSKLAGEALCLADPRPEVRILRLSNVYGEGQEAGPQFLPSLLRQASGPEACLRLSQSLESAKDYLHVGDAIAAMIALTRLEDVPRVINLASGRNVSHGTVVEILQAATGCRLALEPDAPTLRFPQISTARLTALLPWQPRRLESWLAATLAARCVRQSA